MDSSEFWPAHSSSWNAQNWLAGAGEGRFRGSDIP